MRASSCRCANSPALAWVPNTRSPVGPQLRLARALAAHPRRDRRDALTPRDTNTAIKWSRLPDPEAVPFARPLTLGRYAKTAAAALGGTDFSG